MSGFQLFSFVSVLLAGIAGGYYPLTRREVGRREGLPKCQAFAAGVFLALALSMMLPCTGFCLLGFPLGVWSIYVQRNRGFDWVYSDAEELKSGRG